jgi:aerobic carbon-monoxide dehydrogenase medium subunit
MQVPAPFEYERATSVDHAIGLLERLGDTARLVAGGHSLLPMMKLQLANFEYLIDINDLHRELGYVRTGPDDVRIGALTRNRELLESDELAAAFPTFRDAERVIADPVSMEEFHVGPYETAVRDGEMLVEVRFPLRAGGGSAYEKVERRAGDWAVVSAGSARWQPAPSTPPRPSIGPCA